MRIRNRQSQEFPVWCVTYHTGAAVVDRGVCYTRQAVREEVLRHGAAVARVERRREVGGRRVVEVLADALAGERKGAGR